MWLLVAVVSTQRRGRGWHGDGEGQGCIGHQPGTYMVQCGRCRLPVEVFPLCAGGSAAPETKVGCGAWRMAGIMVAGLGLSGAGRAG